MWVSKGTGRSLEIRQKLPRGRQCAWMRSDRGWRSIKPNTFAGILYRSSPMRQLSPTAKQSFVCVPIANWFLVKRFSHRFSRCLPTTQPFSFRFLTALHFSGNHVELRKTFEGSWASIKGETHVVKLCRVTVCCSSASNCCLTLWWLGRFP